MQNKPPPHWLFAETASPLLNSSTNVTLPGILICPKCAVHCLFPLSNKYSLSCSFISGTGFKFKDMNYQVFPHVAYSLLGVMAEKKKSIHRLIAIIGSTENKLAFGVAITPHW